MVSFKTNDEIEISYHCLGNPLAQAVIFINGYSSSEVTWFLQLEKFAQSGFYVISYDHRNHGLSEKTKRGQSLQRLATDLHELILTLNLKKPILIGHSMGAATIMAYEELFTDKDLLAVITEDQAPLFLKSEDWLEGRGKAIDVLDDFIEKFPLLPLTQKPLSDNVKRELGKKMLPFNFKESQNLLRNIIIQDWRLILENEKCPHLFIAGEKSAIFPSQHATAACQLTQHSLSKEIVIKDCGHIPHLESAEEFNQYTLDFIKNVMEG
ncbi:MAG: alpha/beta fold hydrolase [Lactovum sp.]